MASRRRPEGFYDQCRLSADPGRPTQVVLAGEGRQESSASGVTECVVPPQATLPGGWELRRSVLDRGGWFAVNRARAQRFFLGSPLAWTTALGRFERLVGRESHE